MNTWQGNPILAADDANELQRRHYAQGGSDRGQQVAYRQYRRDRHQKAAAFHLQAGTQAAREGRTADAHRHRTMYGLHTRALGYGATHGQVPVEIRSHLETQPKVQRLYTAHPADTWVAHQIR